MLEEGWRISGCQTDEPGANARLLIPEGTCEHSVWLYLRPPTDAHGRNWRGTRISRTNCTKSSSCALQPVEGKSFLSVG